MESCQHDTPITSKEQPVFYREYIMALITGSVICSAIFFIID